MLRVVMVVAALAKVAHADARLEEMGTCGSLRERVEKLGTKFVDGATTTIAVAADATEGGATGSFAILVGGDPQGRRAMTAASCDALLDDLALAIAMVVSAPAAVVAEEPPAIVAEEPWQFSVLGGVETTPDGATSIDLGARVKRGWWSLGMRFVHAIEDDVAVNPGMVRVSRDEIGILACGHLEQLFACGDVAGGWISGSSSGFASNTDATTPFAAAGLRLGWEQPIVDWFALAAYVEGRAALTENRFLIDDMAAWTGARFETQLGIAAIAHFP